MVVTLDDFIKEKKKAEHAVSPEVDIVKPVEHEAEQIKAERVIALTPLGKIKLKQLMLEEKISRCPEPYWWNEFDAPDSIPGCFGSASDPCLNCKKCAVKKLCEEQARCTSGNRAEA